MDEEHALTMMKVSNPGFFAALASLAVNPLCNNH
jgi:hypothetical protein